MNDYDDLPSLAELEANFETFGPEVDWRDVPGLVQAGFHVWAWGYGDDPEAFTTIDRSDLWAWDDRCQPEGRGAIESWAPFRVDYTSEHARNIR